MSSQHFFEPDHNERRQFPRLDRDEKLFLQITRCDDDDRLLGKTILCSTVDVSETGMKLRTESPVATGIEIDLWVNIDGRAGKFFLSGKVQWSMPGEGGHCAGIELLDAENTDIRGWRELFI